MLRSLIRQLLDPSTPPSPALDDLDQLPYHDRAALIGLLTRKATALQHSPYLDWPALVHMETIAICNAACGFCPYPGLERKGVKMSDALIEKIIGDLTAIPKNVRFQLAPYKVSDPFLEARLFDILELVNEKLPNAAISIISNCSPLTQRKIVQLAAIKNLAYLGVSLNYDNAEEYGRSCGFRLRASIGWTFTIAWWWRACHFRCD
jgi:sulfatase maturation enzyme AslB (radical SAM superfamily)